MSVRVSLVDRWRVGFDRVFATGGDLAGAVGQVARDGMRNGCCPTTIGATAGRVALATPRLRGTGERFAAQLFGTGVLRSNALAALVIASFGPGLSTRDVDATLVEALGEFTLDDLFVGASHVECHVHAAAGAVSAAWDIDVEAAADQSAPGVTGSAN